MWILLQRDRNWSDLQLAIQRDTKIHYFFIYINFILISITHLTALLLFCLLAVMVDCTTHQNWYAAKNHFWKQPPPPTPILFTLTIIPTYYQVSKMCWTALVPWALWVKAIGSPFPKFLPSPAHLEHESRHSIQSAHRPVTTHTPTYITHTFNKIWSQSILLLSKDGVGEWSQCAWQNSTAQASLKVHIVLDTQHLHSAWVADAARFCGSYGSNH
jgi:hypothetical protein